jgi:RND family efflux transporter MFP subunit
MNTGEEIPKDLPKVKRHTLVIIAVVAVMAFAALFLLGFIVRHHRISEREKMAKEQKDEAPVVLVVVPKKTQKSTDLTLPADVHAFATTALYSRTNGFLAAWTADINDRVKQGQVLGVISAPDTDADLEQAAANLKQQQTGYQLAQTTEDRYKGLVATQGVTQQQLDQVHSTSEQAKANVGSSAASVDRLKALVGFEKIIAPFDGVVTARNYDVGALIQSTNVAAGQELFDVAEDDKLRVFVSIPQSYALMIKYGQAVKLSLERNFPGHFFSGTVARSAGMLDPSTRTLRTELDFPNTDPAFHILPGMFGEAHFTLDRPAPVLTIPTSALLFESDGKFVAIVKPDDTIHFQPITPGSDFGTDIEVLSGLTGSERVVANPGEQLVEGIKVSAQTNAKDAKGAKDGAAPAAGKDKE